MATLRELLVSLGLDFDATGFAKADIAIRTLKTGLLGVGAVMSATAAALVGVTVAATKQAEELHDNALSVGMTAQALERLGFAAQLSGSNVETLRSGLSVLVNHAGDAARGSKEAAQIFATAGVRFTDGNGQLRDTESIFRDLSDRMAKMRNPTERAALATELLGRNAGPRLVQLMSQGSGAIDEMAKELEELGGSVSEDFVEQSLALGDAIDKVRVIITGIGRVIAQTFMPTLKPMIDRFIEWYKVNRQIIASGIEKTITTIVGAFQMLATIAGSVIDWVRSLFNAFGQFRGVAILVAVALGLVAAAMILPAAPILILVALVGLILNSFNEFRKGNESLVGDVVKEWENFKGMVNGVLDSVTEKIGEFFRTNFPILSAFADAAKVGFDLATKLTGSALNSLAPFEQSEEGRRFFTNMAGRSPFADVSAGATYGVMRDSGTVSINAPITVNAVPGHEKEAAAAITEHFGDAAVRRRTMERFQHRVK